MAGVKLSAESPVTTLQDADLIRITQSGATRSMTRLQNRKYFTTATPTEGQFLKYSSGDWIAADNTFSRNGFTTGTPTPLEGDVLRCVLYPAAPTLASVTPGSPISITTSGAHGLWTGAEVTISGVGGTTAANGTFVITVTSTTTFTLGVNDATAYTSGGTIALATRDWVPANPRWRIINGLVSRYVAIPPSTSTITFTDSTFLSDNFKVGYPVRFKVGGGYLYGIVTVVSGVTLTIAGAPISSTLTELAVGTPEMVVEERFHLPGTYGSSTSKVAEPFKLISNGSTDKVALRWRRPKAFLVTYSATHYNAGATGPKLTPVIGTLGGTMNAVSTDNSNTGIQLSTTDGVWVHSGVGIDPTKYSITLNQDLELSFTAGTASATDLNLLCVFVYE